MKPKLTRDHIRAIAGAIGAQAQGDLFNVNDLSRILEAASFDGFNVTANLAKLNAALPNGMRPIELISLERQQEIYDDLDRVFPGGNQRAWFENERRLVRAALAKVENPHTVTHR
jgi:hypothetical protein